MGEVTGISWCDHTFNPWVGCQKVSPACDGCYAENLMANRFGRVEWGPHGERQRTSEANWKQPLKWNRAALKAGTRPFVFGGSLCDPFDNKVPREWRLDYFDLIRQTPQLVYLLLTKRPQNIVKMAGGGLPGNVALGTTVEDRERLELNLPHLAAARRLNPQFLFVSAEPLLEDLGDVSYWLQPGGIDWVITGGETRQGSHQARPAHPDWFRSLRDQCKAADVPFHLKQWGDWLPWEPEHGPCWVAQNGQSEDHHILLPTDMDDDPSWDDGLWGISEGLSHFAFQKVGANKAGRMLDGRTHDDFPRKAVS